MFDFIEKKGSIKFNSNNNEYDIIRQNAVMKKVSKLEILIDGELVTKKDICINSIFCDIHNNVGFDFYEAVKLPTDDAEVLG